MIQNHESHDSEKEWFTLHFHHRRSVILPTLKYVSISQNVDQLIDLFLLMQSSVHHYLKGWQVCSCNGIHLLASFLYLAFQSTPEKEMKLVQQLHHQISEALPFELKTCSEFKCAHDDLQTKPLSWDKNEIVPMSLPLLFDPSLPWPSSGMETTI